MSFDFKDPDTEILLRRLASALGVSAEVAIKVALRNELSRVENSEAEPKAGGAERDARAARQDPPSSLDKNAFTELNEDG